MFLFYYVWGFFIYILSLTHVWIEKTFLVKNNPFVLRKRTFKYLSYFEKLFLVLFYKKGWFEKTLANLYRKKDIIEYRRDNYPLINIFHLYSDISDYTFDNLKFIVKQYKYFTNSKVFGPKTDRILRRCFEGDRIFFINYLIIQDIFFKRYYNTHSSTFFVTQSFLNLTKLNFIFNIFLFNANNKLYILDLSKWSDWYEYVFHESILKNYGLKITMTRQERRNIRDFRIKKVAKWINMVFKYKKRYKHLSIMTAQKYSGILFFRFNPRNLFTIWMDRDFFKLVKNYYIIKFSESSVSKHINALSLKKYKITYLRKNRIFNKGRYSRNRQLYRTGVYWCLWLNIIMVYGLYFLFYRFSFNFGYIWWGILIAAYSTIFSRIVKYNFFNVFYLYNEFNNLIKWYGYIFYETILFLENKLKNYLIYGNVFTYLSKYTNYRYDFYFSNYYYYLAKLYRYWLRKKWRTKLTYIWRGMKFKDTSFLRYKTVIHWIKELYRVLTHEI